MVTQAMLMAAGLGTRLKPFTDLVPKPLLPVMGVPAAQFALDLLGEAGVSRVVANVHHLPAAARAGLLALDRHGAEMLISDESSLLLGSAGGLKKAEPLFEGKPFFLTNGDVISHIDIRGLARTHALMRSRYGVAMTMAIFPRSPTGEKYREIVVGPDGLVSGFGTHSADRPFFAGLAVLETEALAHVPASGPAEFVPTILEPMIKTGKCAAFVCSGPWKDVGSPRLWLDAHVALIEGLETGAIPLSWRRRLERVNERVASGVWMERSSARPRGLCHGPAYWSGTEDAPRELGPCVVMYGACVGEGRGIGYQRLWSAE